MVQVEYMICWTFGWRRWDFFLSLHWRKNWWKLTSCSTSRILFGKQEETLNKSLCAQMVKRSAFSRDFSFLSNTPFRRQWLKRLTWTWSRLFRVFASESVRVFGSALPDPDAWHQISSSHLLSGRRAGSHNKLLWPQSAPPETHKGA